MNNTDLITDFEVGHELILEILSNITKSVEREYNAVMFNKIELTQESVNMINKFIEKLQEVEALVINILNESK